MAHVYDDRWPYHIPQKKIRDEYEGKHYFPVMEEGEENEEGEVKLHFLYWVRRDLVRVPRMHRGPVYFTEDQLILSYDDFEVHGRETYAQVFARAESLRQGRWDALVAQEERDQQVLDAIDRQAERQGYTQRGGSWLNGVIWLVVIATIIVYGAGVISPDARQVVRGLTARVPFSLPGICKLPSTDLGSDALSVFGSNVQVADFKDIKPVMDGRCLDGVELTGAKLTGVVEPAAVILPAGTQIQALIPSGGCLQIALVHNAGKTICTNVGKYEGDITVVSDWKYWLARNEPEAMKAYQQPVQQGGPQAMPTAAVAP